ncbi:hypothetical protein IWW34DRAFT_132811 [Fusarium oxysporum f. sp. albedinis]|nr:hypothetical protein IWW34DRAFT_132811 [Fusarium oxysporum f. sp. albedinis]KAJ0133683.1 Uncharacterized protein HZ326_23271 [Fusarium oxysporum f. sp. albedinis]KAK2471109.1 hypothetical protein H9L39_17340 [Fusarium oxysporum f. sp. albedinis]
MDRTTDHLNRWKLVSSLYGPGTFLCWICTVASVFISWAVNPDYSRSDSITNDFVAAITLPVVAAAHSFHQLANIDRPGYKPIFLSEEPEDIQLVSALEAALAICEVYIILASFLHCTITRRHQWKRVTCVILTSLLCLSTELVIFFKYPGLPVSGVTFARPFLFDFWFAISAALAVQSLVSGLSIIRIILHARIKMKSMAPRDTNRVLLDRRYTLLERIINVNAGLIIAFIAIVVKSGSVGNTSFYRDSFTALNFRFGPKSSISMTELDQAVALAGGIMTLVFSIFNAFKAHRQSIRVDHDGPSQGESEDGTIT